MIYLKTKVYINNQGNLQESKQFIGRIIGITYY